MPEGVTNAIAERNLLCQPVTTSPSPRHHRVEALLGDVGGIVLLALPDFGVEHIGALEEIGFRLDVAPDYRCGRPTRQQHDARSGALIERTRNGRPSPPPPRVAVYS
jgi:hypothetical protein